MYHAIVRRVVAGLFDAGPAHGIVHAPSSETHHLLSRLLP